MIAAAVIGSPICALLLVIAVGCTCKLYSLRISYSQLGSNYHNSTPITEIQRAIRAGRLAPPPYDEAMQTSRSFDEVQAEIQNQLRLQQEREARSESLSDDVPLLQATGGGELCDNDDVLLNGSDIISSDAVVEQQGGSFQLSEFHNNRQSRFARWGLTVKQLLGIRPRQSDNI